MRHHSILKFCLFVVIICFTTAPAAQKLPPYFEHYNVKNGLSSNIVVCLFKDSRGYVWVGTNDGLNKFNGTSFETYRKDNSNSYSIGGNYIRTIYEDSKGKIWISSDNGKISCLHQPYAVGYEFLNFDLSEHFPSVGGIGINLYFFEDSASNLFAYAESGMLFRYNKSKKKFDQLFKYSGDVNSSISGIFLAMNKKRNEFYILGKGDSLFAINPQNINPLFIPDLELLHFLKRNTNVRKIIQRTGVQQNLLWLLSAGGSLTSFDILTRKISKAIRIPEYLRAANTYIRCIGVNKNGQICFGVSNGGIVLYDTVNKKFERLTLPFELPNENRLAEVYNFLLDESNVLWVSTRSGLYQQSPAMNMFENYTIKQRDSGYNYVININSFFKHGNNLWIGTENHTAFYEHQSNNIKTRNIKNSNAVGSAAIFFKGSDKKVYVNTNGILHFNPEDGQTKEIESNGDSTSVKFFQSARFHSVLKDTINEDEVWWLVGWLTPGWGLYLYNTVSKQVKRFEFNDKNKVIPAISFRGLQKDQFGRIWAGTEGQGLVCVNDLQSGTYAVYKNSAADNTSLPNNLITDLCKDKNGNIWIITSWGGIAEMRFNQNLQPLFKTFSTKQGLHHLALYDAMVDNKNNIWMSSSAGLEKFNINTLSFRHYGYNNGIYNPQFATGCYKDDEGYFYFSSFFTFVKFHPDSIKDNYGCPSVNISRLQVMSHDSTELLLHNNVKLPFNKNTLSFRLEAINHLNARANKYRYKLEGFEKDWIYADNPNYATYTDIPPGTYTFRFSASSNDMEWNEHHPATFSFTIQPPWYQTWWFRTILILVIITAGYFFIRSYVQRKLARQKIMLESKQAIELERMRISTELHDDVGGELSAIRLLSEMNITNISPQQQLSKISSSSGELVQKMNEIVWALNVNNDSLQSLVAYLRRYAVKYLDDMGIDCSFEQPDKIPNEEVDGVTRRNIFLLVKEALNNVVKHAYAKTVEITIAMDNGLQIIVKDNGKGITDDMLQNGTGNGLRNMKQRVKDMEGSMAIKNHDGTTVQFNLPLQRTNTKG